MGQIFDRLERLVRSMTQDSYNRYDPYDEHLSDDDMREAWEELNRFLDEDEGYETSGKPGTSAGTRRPPEGLRKDFDTLGLPFGADYGAVKKAYREQLRLYHPDLHAGDPDKQQQATDVTQKIILAFRRIKDYYENGAA